MTLVDIALATLAVVLGSVVQVVSGVGGGFIIVPLLAWIDLRFVPAPLVFASIALSTLMAVRGRRDVDWGHLPASMLGLLPGSLLGALILTNVAPERLGIVFGSVILLAVAITWVAPRVPLTNSTAIAAGVVAGAMGTSSGIGAAPLALAYQHESGPRVRATLAALYTCASLLILAVLHWFGRFGTDEIVTGLLLMPGFVIGYVVANRFTAHVDRAGSRIAVLAVSAAAAMILIVRSL
jgi:uncharacterized membrane protein YfcA